MVFHGLPGRTTWRVVATGFLLLTLAIVARAFAETDGCYPESWWVDWQAGFPPYVVPAALSLAAGTYCLVRTWTIRRGVAFAAAVVLLFSGAVAIWFLALLDGLAACPP